MVGYAGWTLASTGVALALTYTYDCLKDRIGTPKLIIKEKRSSWIPFSWFSRKCESHSIDVILNPELDRKIQSITKAFQNIQKNNGYFINVLLYGPGGTGKTMIAEQIALQSGMDYVMMSGGDMMQFINQKKQHVSELNKLMESVEPQ